MVSSGAFNYVNVLDKALDAELDKKLRYCK